MTDPDGPGVTGYPPVARGGSLSMRHTRRSHLPQFRVSGRLHMTSAKGFWNAASSLPLARMMFVFAICQPLCGLPNDRGHGASRVGNKFGHDATPPAVARPMSRGHWVKIPILAVKPAAQIVVVTTTTYSGRRHLMGGTCARAVFWPGCCTRSPRRGCRGPTSP